MSRKMSPHQQSPRLRQLQQQLGGGPPLRSRNGGSPRQNGGGARVGDVIQAPQVRTTKTSDLPVDNQWIIDSRLTKANVIIWPMF